MHILGVVLAGGRSSRMGRDKALLEHASGVIFLDYAIGRISPLVASIAISGRRLDSNTIECVPDQTPGLGPAMAVWSAILFAKQRHFSAILITPIDMPDLETMHLQRLVQSAVADQPTCVTFDGVNPHPLVAIYPVSLEGELQVVAQSVRRSLRAWLASRPHVLVKLPETAQRDFNEPE